MSEYYDVGGISTIDVIEAKLSTDELMGWYRGQVIKYVTRMTSKGELQKDAVKLAYYANKLNELLNPPEKLENLGQPIGKITEFGMKEGKMFLTVSLTEDAQKFAPMIKNFIG